MSELKFSVRPYDLPAGLSFSWGGNIKLWENTTKETEPEVTVARLLTLYTADQLENKPYFIEGYVVSSQVKDTSIVSSVQLLNE